MNRLFSMKISVIIILSIMFSETGIYAQTDTNWTAEKAAIWYNQGEWLKGLKLRPHESTDKVEFAKQYNANKKWWNEAFAFLNNNNLDSLKPGKYVIDGEDVFADITDNPSSELKEAKWHSHRQYCDIQYVIQGKENTGVVSIVGVPIAIPFKDNGDSQFYSQDLKGKYYLSSLNTFFIFFPSDIHRPFIKVEGYNSVKRIRFKIRSR